VFPARFARSGGCPVDIGALAVPLCKKGLFWQASLSGVHYSLSEGRTNARRVCARPEQRKAVLPRDVERAADAAGNRRFEALVILSEVFLGRRLSSRLDNRIIIQTTGGFKM
jgi:hypothetical protein